MKISATSGGGFAGLSEHYEIDTETSASGRALETALTDTGFFAAPADVIPDAAGADMTRWRITVTGDGRQHTVSFTEDGGAAAARWQHLLTQIRAAT
jgi:hypothetical protein